MTKIIPIILSGGAGSRLWPVSRRMHPKPFMHVAGKPLYEINVVSLGKSSETVFRRTRAYYAHNDDR